MGAARACGACGPRFAAVRALLGTHDTHQTPPHRLEVQAEIKSYEFVRTAYSLWRRMRPLGTITLLSYLSR